VKAARPGVPFVAGELALAKQNHSFDLGRFKAEKDAMLGFCSLWYEPGILPFIVKVDFDLQARFKMLHRFFRLPSHSAR